MLHEIRGSDNLCTDMVADYCQHELLPHKTCLFTGQGMPKYSHKSR